MTRAAKKGAGAAWDAQALFEFDRFELLDRSERVFQRVER